MLRTRRYEYPLFEVLVYWTYECDGGHETFALTYQVFFNDGTVAKGTLHFPVSEHNEEDLLQNWNEMVSYDNVLAAMKSMPGVSELLADAVAENN